MKATEISPTYKKPVIQAAGLSFILLILSLMVLDLGETIAAAPFSLAAFWGVTVLIILQRPTAPTVSDIRFIRFGSLPVFILAQAVVRGIWYLRGVQF